MDSLVYSGERRQLRRAAATPVAGLLLSTQISVPILLRPIACRPVHRAARAMADFRQRLGALTRRAMRASVLQATIVDSSRTAAKTGRKVPVAGIFVQIWIEPTAFAALMSSKWLVGLLFSLVLGHLAVSVFLLALRRALSAPEKPATTPLVKQVPAWLTGLVERVFFTILVGFEVAGAPIAMVAWLALKLASNWNHPDWKDEPHAWVLAFSALLAGLISMLFALFGGLIWAGNLSVGV